MAKFSIKGQVTKVEPGQMRGELYVQNFVVTNEEAWGDKTYTTDFALTIFDAEKATTWTNDHLLEEGAKVEVIFGIKSREYNGKYYTDLRCYEIKSAEAQMLASAAETYPAGPTAPTAKFDGTQQEIDGTPF